MQTRYAILLMMLLYERSEWREEGMEHRQRNNHGGGTAAHWHRSGEGREGRGGGVLYAFPKILQVPGNMDKSMNCAH